MGCCLHDNRLHCSVAIFFCPVLQFRGFDVTSERGLYSQRRDISAFVLQLTQQPCGSANKATANNPSTSRNQRKKAR